MRDVVQYAQDFAAKAHEGQVDKAGTPYYFHVLRVSAAGKTVEEQVVGALHDVLEDTPTTALTLDALFGTKIALAVFAMTHMSNEKYEDYITRLAKNPIAKAVKLNDLRDNLSRLSALEPKVAARLKAKYSAALVMLGSY